MTDDAPVSRSVLAVVDLLAAAALLAGGGLAVITAVVLAAGSDLVAVKRAVFAAGLLVAGIAVLQHRSAIELRRDGDRAVRTDADPGTESRLRPLLEAVLPEAWQLRRRDRLPETAKLAVAGLLLLLVSYLMEAVAGIGA